MNECKVPRIPQGAGSARMSRFPAALLGIAMLSMAGAVSGAQADDGFTERSIRGSWAFSASGIIVPPAVPESTPAVALGIMRFDGAGGCVIEDTINIGGTSASRISTACDYLVKPDGTGSIQAVLPGDPFPVPLAFVIVNKKAELRFIRIDLGVASGVAKRQREAE